MKQELHNPNHPSPESTLLDSSGKFRTGSNAVRSGNFQMFTHLVLSNKKKKVNTITRSLLIESEQFTVIRNSAKVLNSSKKVKGCIDQNLEVNKRRIIKIHLCLCLNDINKIWRVYVRSNKLLSWTATELKLSLQILLLSCTKWHRTRDWQRPRFEKSMYNTLLSFIRTSKTNFRNLNFLQ